MGRKCHSGRPSSPLRLTARSFDARTNLGSVKDRGSATGTWQGQARPCPWRTRARGGIQRWVGAVRPILFRPGAGEPGGVPAERGGRQPRAHPTARKRRRGCGVRQARRHQPGGPDVRVAGEESGRPRVPRPLEGRRRRSETATSAPDLLIRRRALQLSMMTHRANLLPGRAWCRLVLGPLRRDPPRVYGVVSATILPSAASVNGHPFRRAGHGATTSFWVTEGAEATV